ncbi:ABC transporter ATP-binding protein, partial [Halosimplex sp. J119]
MSDTQANSIARSAQVGGDTVLRVRNADVMFDMDRGTSKVLNDVSMDVQRGETLGIVGESGSGKSMFASSIIDAVVEPGILDADVTYYPPSGGEVDVLDLPEDDLRAFRWEEISMVFQGAMSSFNPTTKIETHFVETLRAHRADVDEGMERARTLLSDLYLEPDRVFDAYPHELSGGMKQRALIALALVLEPEVVVMDEPTASLDLLMQRSIIQLMERLKEKYDLTLIFISHDLALVSELADRLAVMYAFQFVEEGPAGEIVDSATHPYTRALLKSMPNMDAPVSDMEPIEGSSPDPVDDPAGCSYHPRCPLADEQCVSEDPKMLETDDGHRVACFHWEAAPSKIDIEVEPDHENAITAPERDPDAERLVALDDVEVHFEDNDGLLGLFGESQTVHAVDGVDLEIAERDVVALVGESGCGKTTLGKTAVGLQEPTGGTLTYHGADVWEAEAEGRTNGVEFEEIRKSLQVIHQDPGSSLNPHQRIKDILSEPLRKWYANLDGETRFNRVLQILSLVGMEPPEDYAERFPHQLSGGEQQRVALGRALLMNPDLILADEAVSALDVSLRIEMMDLFLQMQKQFDTSYLFISHDLSNARYLAEKSGGRIGVMYLGEIVEIGSVDKILRDPVHPYTKALLWATPGLDTDETEMPLRTVDIPDAKNPPSGCRFHTRCPEAREICTRQTPDLETVEARLETACFRTDEDHEYWESEPITGDEETLRGPR